MKIAIIGPGNVGLATFRELQGIPGIDEICLIGRNIQKVQAEVDDYHDAFILRGQAYPVISSGSYENTADADIIVYSAGAPQKGIQNRLELTSANLQITDEIFTEVNKYNKHSIIIAVTNPVDIITWEIVRITGRPRSRVIGTGTLLDTARCIRILSSLLDISPRSLSLYVIGEHGDSSVTVLSSLRILGMTFDEYLSQDIGFTLISDKESLANAVRSVGGKIMSQKGATAYGVSSAVARIILAIIQDEHVLLPVSSVLDGEYGVKDIAISVPCLIGKEGIQKIMPLNMTQEETQEFNHSIETLKNILNTI